MNEDPMPSGASPNPLSLADTSKKPTLDYQWFRWPRKTGEPDWPYRNPRHTGWVAVQRKEMPKEDSDEPNVIQRNEMRLFRRPKEISDKARERDIAKALRDIRVLEGHPVTTEDGDTYYAQPTRASIPKLEPWSWSPLPQKRISKTNRGRLLVLHEAVTWRWISKIIMKFPPACARRHIVFIPAEEREMACRCHVSYADWAWAKHDLLLEGAIGTRGIYRQLPTRYRWKWWRQK